MEFKASSDMGRREAYLLDGDKSEASPDLKGSHSKPQTLNLEQDLHGATMIT